MLQAVPETCKWTAGKSDAICTLIVMTTEYMRVPLPRIYIHVLSSVIVQQPYRRMAALGIFRDMPFAKDSSPSVLTSCCSSCATANTFH
jgi:hypothetical protein